MIGTFSGKLSRLPGLTALLGEPVVHLHSAWQAKHKNLLAIAGWGQRRPWLRRPRMVAARLGLPFVSLEDGFLRAYGTGVTHPTLSLVVDTEGIYYDATRPSALELLLASDADLLSGLGADHARARELILQERLSKYNLAPDLDSLPGVEADRPRVLVVDQTRGDAAIRYGLADDASFAAMLDTARQENPDALIYVKTHPEVSNGRKRGYYADMNGDERTIMLRDAVNPLSLLPHMDRVYVVTSHLGFEALLAGVPVTCFGMPWYAGWGTTDDRLGCERRTKQRSMEELFAAAYLHYTRYLNPETHGPGTIFDVIGWLTRQRKMASLLTGRSIAIGYRRWKAENVRPFLAMNQNQVHFVGKTRKAARLEPGPQDRLIVWGADPSQALKELADRSGATLLRMEDGFIRSVGLGSDFVPPLSLVLDGSGIYFDPRQPSDLENLLNAQAFTDRDRERAANVRALIIEHEITKYNIEPHAVPAWRQADKHVVLVPGQVEDDASIRHGCEDVRTNLALLREARRACPDAYIVYKPHPDVMVRNRAGKVHHDEAMQHADAIETQLSIVSCIAACDEVHTMTSLAGFDALLRQKKVVVYGRPFYAGWGLTEDRLPFIGRTDARNPAPPSRRARALTLDELVAGALLHYPLYWDWTLSGFTTCEAAIMQIVRRREALLAHGGLESARMNSLQRQWHKIKLWARAGFVVTG